MKLMSLISCCPFFSQEPIKRYFLYYFSSFFFFFNSVVEQSLRTRPAAVGYYVNENNNCKIREERVELSVYFS